MKKVLLFAAVIAMSASMTSCKKTWVCKCTVNAGGVSASATSAEFKATKSDAEESCNATATTYGGSSTCEAVKQ